MTRVCFREYYDRTLISVEGHSGFGENGTDIVCSAVSALAFTLANCIQDEEGDDRLKLNKNIVRDGYVFFEFEVFPFARERIEGMTEAIMTGFLMLAEKYPEYVSVE